LRGTQALEALQKLAPSQSESEAQVVGHSRRVPSQTYAPQSGEPVLPAASAVQVPGWVPLQRSHEPVQAVVQQTPSAQNPEAHSASRVHAAPGAFPLPPPPVHAPPLQLAPLTQSADVAHHTGQPDDVPLQR
jgi:hypothetical protein